MFIFSLSLSLFDKQHHSIISLADLNALKVINVDELHNRNQSDHYTQLYEFDELGKQRSSRLLSRLTSSNREPKRRPLIVRRGQSFDLKVIFNREFRKGEDLVNLVFNLNGNLLIGQMFPKSNFNWSHSLFFFFCPFRRAYAIVFGQNSSNCHIEWWEYELYGQL